MPRTRSAGNVTPPEGCWIRYQLSLRDIKFEKVAQKASCGISTVSNVISGVKHSKRVEKVLAEMLGFDSFADLMAIAAAQSKGGVA
jgi:hypothetical protein